MIDKLKIGLAGAILFGGFWGYYQLPELMGQQVSILLCVGLVLLAVILATIVVISSSYGGQLIEFAKGSRTELRKMVWPTRQETQQTTLIVLALVVLVALILWAIDALVFNIIYDFILGVDD